MLARFLRSNQFPVVPAPLPVISLDPAPVPPPSLAPSLTLVKFMRFLRLSFSDTPTTNKADNRQTDSHRQCSVNRLVPDEIR